MLGRPRNLQVMTDSTSSNPPRACQWESLGMLHLVLLLPLASMSMGIPRHARFSLATGLISLLLATTDDDQEIDP